jgi:hypothetical protein
MSSPDLTIAFLSSSRKDDHAGRIEPWLIGAFLLGVAIILVQPLFSHLSWMVFIQDDLLYYLKVAQSIAAGHGSSFNGLVLTNGYQPLFLIFLIGLSYITKNPRAILGFVALMSFLSAVVTFFLARKIIQTANVRPLLVFSLAAWTTLYSLTLFFYGMEVTLTVPLILGIICILRNISWVERSALHTFSLGLLLTLMVLSRIDTLILGGLILGGMLASPSLRSRFRPALVLGLMCGMLPLVGYFLLNHFMFQTWLPISGMAKELKFGHAPSLEPWRVFFHPLAGFFTTVLLTALVVLSRIRRQFEPIDRVLFPAVILFPFVYYFILSCVSDWTLWGWYYYPIRTALCVSFLIFCTFAPFVRLLERPVVIGLLLLSVVVCLSLMRWTRQQADIYAASLEIQEFATRHPGIYAMGDRAGRVAYLIPDPVVQTEGLMMDREYLRYVEKQTPLREVLKHYNVRYYIATAYDPFQGCFEAAEPAKAGPTSAHMRAEFCEDPAASYFHDGIETLIFDLSKSN